MKNATKMVKPRVLYVDDEPENLVGFKALFRREYDVYTAETGKEALEIMERSDIQVLIADQRMPGMTGVELLEKAAARYPNMIRFILTGYSDFDPLVEAINMGRIQGYFSKPLDASSMKKRVEDGLKNHYLKIENIRLVEELKESDSFLNAIIEHIPNMIFVKDAKELRFVRFNKAGEELLGYSREELIGKNDYDIFPKEEADFFTEKDRNVLSSGEHLDIPEEPIQTKYRGERILHTKKIAILDDEGKPRYLLGISEDITERKKAEKALRDSERRLHAIFDHHYQLTGLVDTEGRLLAANRTALHFTGAEESEVIGRYFWDGPWWDPSQSPELRNAVERAANGEFVRFETTHPAADGEIRVIDFSLSPVRDDDGHVIYIVPEGRDITEIRRAEEGKAMLQEQLIQAQKMEAIGTLAGGIAHDFNNILSVIIGYTEIALMDELIEDKPIKSNLEEINKASLRAKDLVKQILTFSRQTEYELKPVQVRLIAHEVLKLLRSSLPSTIEIQQDLQSDCPIMADPTQVHQILMNLCTNAGHAMAQKGGILKVDLSNVELDSFFTDKHQGLKPGPYLKLTVSDTGQGIPPHVLERIFEPFYTTKEKGAGTGMGLSVVHGIVQSFGGIVTVYSEPEKGSVFNVFLPLLEEKVESKTKVERPIPTGTECILFVDDEKPLTEIGKRLLESLGYEVMTRTSSIEALELFKSVPERFDVVITDLTMPKLTGEKLAEQLLQIKPTIPIILCTGFNTKIDEDKAKAMGIRAFILKPILKRDIAEAIRSVLEEKKY
jgi:PAS domain S-box-containing protein